MTKKELNEVLELLKNDEHYYGELGKQFLSNSDIYNLQNDPLRFQEKLTGNPNLIKGGYFHTLVLEPDKLNKYKLIDASTRNTKVYKDLSDGEMCLLQHEADSLMLLRDTLMENETARGLIRDIDVEYEVPGVQKLAGEWWKLKADIKNNTQGLIIDIKTTGDINKFRQSANTYNYDSQAYIYSTYFKMDFIFVAIDKTTHRIGIYDCSPKFLESGKFKVEEAVEAYNLYYKNENFNPKNYFINKTL